MRVAPRASQTPLQRRSQALAMLWLSIGSLLLLLTPLGQYDEAWGWTPMFWLLIAPLSLLLTLRPTLPLNLLASALRAQRRGW